MTASGTPEDAPPEDAPPEGAVKAAADSVPDRAEPPLAAPDAADEEEEEEEEDRGDPLFEVSDRRATILADRVGIVFRLDGEEADFTWDEIGAVEIDTPRFGKRFAVTVYTGPRRWFEAHVEAKSRGLLKTWTAELDAVLDEHFEDPEEKAAAESAQTAPDTKAAAKEAVKDDAEATAAPDADDEAKAGADKETDKATDEDKTASEA